VEVITEPWIYWAQAAVRHRDAAQKHRNAATSGLPIGAELVRATLEEFPAAMQAIAAAAFAIDGFDGAVGDEVALPTVGPPRARAVLTRLETVFDIPASDRARHQADLDWLFKTRNQAVHADVRTDPSWRHPSGINVSAVQREISLEAAGRAVAVCTDFITTCLGAPRPGAGLDEWVVVRRGRFEALR
jgi:hypothetical protein